MTYKMSTPTPGVFWQRKNPEAPVFFSAGDKINKGDVVGVMEVMKMFVDLTAEKSGTFIDYLVENGESLAVGVDVAEIEEDS